MKYHISTHPMVTSDNILLMGNSCFQWEAYISPPPPKSKPGPGPGNPDVLAKTKTFIFWHIVEISARYCRQIDRTDVAHLFCFQEIMKNWPRGPKKRPMTPKIFFLGVQKRGPWLLKNMGAIFLRKKKRLRQHRGSSRASRNMGAIFLEKNWPRGPKK